MFLISVLWWSTCINNSPFKRHFYCNKNMWDTFKCILFIDYLLKMIKFCGSYIIFNDFSHDFIVFNKFQPIRVCFWSSVVSWHSSPKYQTIANSCYWHSIINSNSATLGQDVVGLHINYVLRIRFFLLLKIFFIRNSIQ